MFANNKASINCCGESPFMTSMGCVCLTENQREFIRSRGLNKGDSDILLIFNDQSFVDELDHKY